MKLLAVDSSSARLSIAVCDGETLCATRHMTLQRSLSDRLLPAINGVLTKAGLKTADLDGFVFGLGPGSFTSLRVGAATMKGLSFATRKPVVGVASFDAVIAHIPVEGTLCMIADARRQLVYAAVYTKTTTHVKRVGDYRLVAVSDLLADLSGEVTFVGDGIPVYREEIARSRRIIPTFAAKKYWYPQARYLPALAQGKMRAREDQADRLVPLYLYPEDCQVRSHATKKK